MSNESLSDVLARADALIAKPYVRRPTLTETTGVVGAGVLTRSERRKRLGLAPSNPGLELFGLDGAEEALASQNQVQVNRLRQSLRDGALARNAKTAAARALAVIDYPDADAKTLKKATAVNLGTAPMVTTGYQLDQQAKLRAADAVAARKPDPYAGIGDPRLTGTEDLERSISVTNRQRALTSNLGRMIEGYRSNDPNAVRLASVAGGVGESYRGTGHIADVLGGGHFGDALANARDAEGNPWSNSRKDQATEVFGQAALNAVTTGLGAAAATGSGGANAFVNAFRDRSLLPLLRLGTESGGTSASWVRGVQALDHSLSMADLGGGMAQAGSIALDPSRTAEERKGGAMSAALMAAFMTPAAAGHLLTLPAARRAAEVGKLVPELKGLPPGAFGESVLGAIKRGADPRDISMLLGQDLSRADFDARRVAGAGAKLTREPSLGMTVDPVTGRALDVNEGAYAPDTGTVHIREDAHGSELTHELDHHTEATHGLDAEAIRSHVGPEGYESIRKGAYDDAVRRLKGRGMEEGLAQKYADYWTSPEELPRYLIDTFQERGRGTVKKLGGRAAKDAAAKLVDLFEERQVGKMAGARISFDAAAREGLAGGPNYDPAEHFRLNEAARVAEGQDRADVFNTGGTAEQRARVGAPAVVDAEAGGGRFVGLTAAEQAQLKAIHDDHAAEVAKPRTTGQMADEARTQADTLRDKRRADLFAKAGLREENTRRVAIGAEPIKEPVAAAEPAAAKRTLGGVVVGEGESFTPDGKTKVPVRMRVVERGDVVVSHDTSGRVNSEYPGFAQPRDRSLPGEKAKIDEQARGLSNDLLLNDFKSTDRGAPVVGEDGVVESGNGRVLALDRAKEINPEGYQAYMDELRRRFPAAKDIKDPVLVQERVGPTDDVTRAKIAGASNEGSSSAMNTVETAKQDAGRLVKGIEDRFELTGRNVEESLQSPRNRELLQHFVDNLPASERPAMFDTDGGFSVQAKSRFARALAAKALGEGAQDVLYRMHLEGDVLQRIVRGLELSSSELLKMRAAADAGNEVAGGMGDALVQALRYADEARSQMGGKAAEWFDQGALSGIRDPNAMRIGKMLVESPNQEAVADLVRSLSRAASDSGGGMFGDEMAFKNVRESVDSIFGDRSIAPDVQRSKTFSGNEFVPLDEHPEPREFRDRAKTALRDLFAKRQAEGKPGSSIVHPETGQSITLTMKDARGHWLQESTGEWKKRLAPHVLDALEDSRYVGEDPLTKPATPEKQKIHIYENDVTLGGEKKMVHFIVRENDRGQFFLRDVQEQAEGVKKRGAAPAEQSGDKQAARDYIVPPDSQNSKSFSSGGEGEPAPKKSIISRIIDAVSRGKVGRDDPTVPSGNGPAARKQTQEGKAERPGNGEVVGSSPDGAEPSPMDGMGLSRRPTFELSKEQQAQTEVGEKMRQADLAYHGETRGVEFQGKTYRNWEEAKRLGSILNDRTDILKRLGSKDPGAGISDVERAAAFEELQDIGARLDDLQQRAAEARDLGDNGTAGMHEALAEDLRGRYAELSGKVMDLTSDNGRNLAATRMFVDTVGGDVQRQLRRARAEAKRALKPDETRKISDAAQAVGALMEAVNKERVKILAEAEAALAPHRGATITLKDLGKAKQGSVTGAPTVPMMSPVEALTRIAQNLAGLGELDPAKLKGYARERLGIDLADDAAAELMRRGGERHANPKPETPTEAKLQEKKRTLEEAHDEVTQTTGSEFLNSLYKAGLLSTLRAGQASLVGNAISRVMEDAARMPASVIDSVLSLRTGKRTVSTAGTIAGQRAAYSVDAAKAAAEALLHGGDFMGGEKYGQPARSLDYRLSGGKTEGPRSLLRPLDPVTRGLSWGINKVFHGLEAADRPAFIGELTRSLIEQATLDAKAEGLKGEDVRSYVRSKLGANPDARTVVKAAMASMDASPGGMRDLVQRAKKQAEEAILANSSPGTKAAGAVSEIPILGPLFLPFPKIPTNAVARGMEWSPLGIAYGLGRTIQVLHAGDLGAQKKAANALARGLLGSSALLYLGYKARELGFISAATPTDQGMRATEEAAGQQGSSVKVGGRWISYRDVPQLMVLSIGAGIYDAQQSAKLQGKPFEKGDAVSAGLSGMADSALDLPTLQGVQDATQAIQEVARAKAEGDDALAAVKGSKFVQGLGGSIIAKGAQDTMTAGDPYQRELSTFAERFKAGTPGRKDLPLRYDALGKPVPRVTGLLGQVRGVSPDQSERMADPLAQELLRLRVPMTPAQRVRLATRADRDITTADYAERKKVIGTGLNDELRRLIASPWYSKATDVQRRAELLAVRKEVRHDVADDLKDRRERERR